MTSSNVTVAYAERVYTALLSLYPAHFRLRFAPEMIQLFRDCCHDALEKGEVAVLVALFLRTAGDLCRSIFCECRRELICPMNAEHPLVGLIDSLLIPSMVTANLLSLGPILTLLIGGGASIPVDQFAAISAFFSFAVGSLAVAASFVMTKLRPTVRLWMKLSQ